MGQNVGIIYYTGNWLKKDFAKTVRDSLKKSAGNIPIVWSSQEPIDERPNIVLKNIGLSAHSRCRQILAGIQNIDADIIFFAEHDVIYHSSHFNFIPKDKDVFYYNLNRWWLRSRDGQASFRDVPGALSQLVAHKGIIEDFFVRRIAFYDKGKKVKCGTEPGKKNCKEMPQYKIGYFYSEAPNIDIRHKYNFTKRDRFTLDYKLRDNIPFWGRTKGRYKEFIKELNNGK